MATVTGLTADRMLEIEAESIVDAALGGVTGYHLILTRHDGTPIDVGDIRGAVGPQGPPYANGVDTVTDDQVIAARKTFSKKVSVQLPGPTPALHIGTAIAGQADALNITPYGAAAAVIVSGADYDTGTSTARAGSASMVEFLNAGLNFYADTGLTPGATFGRTKRMSIDSNGVTLTGYNPGTTHESIRTLASSQIFGTRGFGVNADAQGFQGGVTVGLSVAIARTDPGLSVFNASGDSIRGYGSGGLLTFSVSSSGKTSLSAGGGSTSQNVLDIFASPASGYALIYGHTNWGVGSGGDLINLANTVGSVFSVDSNGLLNWGPGRNVAGLVTAGAVAGTGVLPANPQAFMVIKIQGTAYKIPLYNY